MTGALFVILLIGAIVYICERVRTRAAPTITFDQERPQ